MAEAALTQRLGDGQAFLALRDFACCRFGQQASVFLSRPIDALTRKRPDACSLGTGSGEPDLTRTLAVVLRQPMLALSGCALDGVADQQRARPIGGRFAIADRGPAVSLLGSAFGL